MMKKIISLFLCLVMATLNCSTGFAVNANNRYLQKLDTKYYCNSEYEDIYTSIDGEYALKADGITFPMERIDIILSSQESVGRVINNKNIPLEVRESITESCNNYKDSSRIIIATLFVPAGTTGARSTTETYDYNYNGTLMRNYRVYYTGIETGYKNLKSGSQTKTYANTVTSVALSLASATTQSLILGYISGGYSLYQAFVALYGSSFATGTYHDYVQLLLRFDNINQWTYAYLGGEWLLGLCAQKVTITYAHLHQYYYNSSSNSGNSTDHYFNSSKVIQSTHYASPWATALQWAGNSVDEWVTATINGVTFYF